MSLHEDEMNKAPASLPAGSPAIPVDVVDIAEAARRLSLGGEPPTPAPGRGLDQWKMERDDAPILRYLLGGLAPRRHLEFGTWQGFGTLLVLKATAAAVWTLNLLDGEMRPESEGKWAYGVPVTDEEMAADPALASAALWSRHESFQRGITYYQTDSYGFIGRLYREAGLSHRVCQIYCDSREWDTSNYPAGFFDSCFIDGGHTPEVAVSDTRKALPLVRPGGLVLWHDFCPVPSIMEQQSAPRGVVTGLGSILEEIRAACDQLFWIHPSQVLVGRRR